MANDNRTERAGVVPLAGVHTLNGRVATPVAKVTVRDNTEFIDRFDEGKFRKKVTRVKRTLVIAQDPEPGEIVPAGTPVNLTLVDADDIPTDILEVNPAVRARYAKIGALRDDLEKDDDPTALAVRVALENKKEYNDLSADERETLRTWAAERFGAEAVATEEQEQAVVTDILFMLNL